MTDDIFGRLKAPFHPDKVSWRVGATNKDKTKGMALAYIDARDVYERLDEVVGPANWQNRYPHAGTKTCCDIALRIDGEWVWKSNGAGDSDHEAEKGAFSDGFKRAAVCWGIGRYLYDLDSPWVEIEAYGKSYKIKPDQYRILRRVLTDGAEPAKAPPARQQQAGVDQARQKAVDFKDAFIADVRKCGSLDDLRLLKTDSAKAKALQALADRHHDLWDDVQSAIAKHETTILERAAA